MSSTNYRAALVRQVEWWGDGFPPPCGCGCGEPTRFNTDGPQQFVNRSHFHWSRSHSGYHGAIRTGNKEAEFLDVEKFRQACRTIMDKKGWTVAELAERGGWGRGQLSQYIYGGKGSPKSVGVTTAKSFLRRASGLPETPSPYQVRKEAEKMKKLKRWEKANG